MDPVNASSIMLGPEKRYTFKRKPWTLFDRLAVTCLISTLAFVGAFLVWVGVPLRTRAMVDAVPFEWLLWLTGAVAIVTFLLTFTRAIEGEWSPPPRK